MHWDEKQCTMVTWLNVPVRLFSAPRMAEIIQ